MPRSIHPVSVEHIYKKSIAVLQWKGARQDQRTHSYSFNTFSQVYLILPRLPRVRVCEPERSTASQSVTIHDVKHPFFYWFLFHFFVLPFPLLVQSRSEKKKKKKIVPAYHLEIHSSHLLDAQRTAVNLSVSYYTSAHHQSSRGLLQITRSWRSRHSVAASNDQPQNHTPTQFASPRWSSEGGWEQRDLHRNGATQTSASLLEKQPWF